MLRIKELQNQLADAHYQLNELSNENKLLKSLQKRQDSALKRYEGTNAELPRIINSHHEELRVLQLKYKKLKALHKETCDLLKEKENELQQLQCQNKHLLQLSKDRHLEEREKLQLQVSDLNHRIQQQQDTIQMLHRKLTLESKSMKHQLHVEVTKRKETQKSLAEATEKLRNLETLLDNRERKLYSNGQLQFPNRNRQFGTQSLTNLRDISSSNPLKLSAKCEKWQTNAQDNTLPIVSTPELNDRHIIKMDEQTNSNRTSNSMKSETMENLKQVRKFRLQKPSHKGIFLGNSEENYREPDFTESEDSKVSTNLENLKQSKKQEASGEHQYDISVDKFRKIYQHRKHQNLDKLNSPSGSSESENENRNLRNNYPNTIDSSRLHIRLNDSAGDTVDSKELTPSECDRLKVLVEERKNSYKSDLEIEPEIKDESTRHYSSVDHQSDALKLISSICDNQIHYNPDAEIEKLTSKSFLNGSRKIYQDLIQEIRLHGNNVENESSYSQYHAGHTEEEYTDSEDTDKYVHKQATPRRKEYDNTYIQSEFKNETPSQIFSGEEWNQDAASFAAYSEIENKNTMIKSNDVETKNKLNMQGANTETSNADTLNNVQWDGTNSVRDTSVINNEVDTSQKSAAYIKEKLLATMKAIDDNENIEFLNQDYKDNLITRQQTTQNLFHGLPTHMKKKQDIIKDIFDTDAMKLNQ